MERLEPYPVTKSRCQAPLILPSHRPRKLTVDCWNIVVAFVHCARLMSTIQGIEQCVVPVECSGVVDATYNVKAEDIRKCLVPGCWTNVDLVNLYVSSINGFCGDRFIFGSWTFHKTTQMGYDLDIETHYPEVRVLRRELGKTFSANPDLKNTDRLLFPVQIRFSYWIACVIDFERQSFEIYDSMASPSLDTAWVFRVLRCYMRITFDLFPGATLP